MEERRKERQIEREQRHFTLFFLQWLSFFCYLSKKKRGEKYTREQLIFLKASLICLFSFLLIMKGLENPFVGRS